MIVLECSTEAQKKALFEALENMGFSAHNITIKLQHHYRFGINFTTMTYTQIFFPVATYPIDWSKWGL